MGFGGFRDIFPAFENELGIWGESSLRTEKRRGDPGVMSVGEDFARRAGEVGVDSSIQAVVQNVGLLPGLDLQLFFAEAPR